MDEFGAMTAKGNIENGEPGQSGGGGWPGKDLSHYGDVHLPHHLLAIGLHEHLLFLLRDVDFLAAKVAATGADELLGDLRAAWVGVPPEFDSKVDAGALQTLRLQLADNLRLFAREGFKFGDRDSTDDREMFDRRYLYGAQRWQLDTLQPYVRDKLDDPDAPIWSLRWIVDREAHALEESRVFDGANRFLLSHDGGRLLVARDESIDVYDTATWRREDSIPFVEANVLECIEGGDRILIANRDALEIWDLAALECVQKIACSASSGFSRSELVGDRFVFIGTDDEITRVQLETGQVDIWSSPSRITAWCPKPDGSSAIVGNIDGQIRVLNGNATSDDDAIGSHDDFVTAITTTPDGKWIVSGSQDGLVYRWSLDNVEESAKLAKVRFSIQRLTIDQRGRFLVATTIPYGGFGRMSKNGDGDADPEIVTILSGTQEDIPTDVFMWRLPDWRFAGELSDVDSEVDAIAFSPSGRWLMMGYVNGSVELWDMEDDALAAGAPPVNRKPAKASDPTQLIGASVIRNLLIIIVGLIGLSITHSTSLWQGVGFVLGGTVLTWVFSAVSTYLSSRTGWPPSSDPPDDVNALAKDLARATLLVTVFVVLFALSTVWVSPWIAIFGVAMAPTVARIVGSLLPPVSLEPESTEQDWTLTPVRYGGHGASVNWLRMSPGEDRLFSAATLDQTLKTWKIDADDKSPTASHDGDIEAIARIPGRHWVTSAGMDGRLAYWDVDTGASHGIGKGHHREITAMSVAGDDSYVVTSGKDHKVIIWWLTGEIPQAFSGHEAIVADAKPLSDGRVASVDVLGNLLVWDVSTGEVVLQHEFSDQPQQAHITELVIAPDESFLIGVPGSAFGFWQMQGVTLNIDNPITPMLDLQTGKEVGHLPLATGVRFLASSDEVLLFVSDRLRRFNLNTLESRSLGSHDAEIRDVVVTPSASHAVSIGSDDTIRSWDLNTNQPRDVQRVRGKPTAAALTSTAAVAVVGTDSGDIYAFRTIDLGELTSVCIDGVPKSLCFARASDDDGSESLLVGDDAGRIYCFDYLPWS